MTRLGRNSLLLFVVGLLVAGFSLIAVAAEEGGDEEGGGTDSSTTTINSGLSPAVPIVEEEAAPELDDWTYRYIVPTGLALAAIIVLVTAIKYFTDVVRKRYRIVDE
ncbi:MAG TPA: hypothetical protein VFT85_06710 [Acidimicrobiia bacterium]|nr:hypothetical protein [Acidimicrobiia bacterium]